MKKIVFVLALFLIKGFTLIAQVENSSYINHSNEKVLQLSFTVPVDKKEAWQYFADDRKLAKWAAPLAHIELKSGGYMVTNYDSTKSLTDSSSIRLQVMSFLENELLILKVKLNNNFSKKVQAEDQYLQEIIRFVSVAPNKTKIISSMIGWGQGADWDKTYNFFMAGNEWTYKEFLKLFK